MDLTPAERLIDYLKFAQDKSSEEIKQYFTMVIDEEIYRKNNVILGWQSYMIPLTYVNFPRQLLYMCPCSFNYEEFHYQIFKEDHGKEQWMMHVSKLSILLTSFIFELKP